MAGDPWCRLHGDQLCACMKRLSRYKAFEAEQYFTSPPSGRLLTEEETEWLSVRWFHEGVDVDSCEPQLNHIVWFVKSGEARTLCETADLWFHCPGFNTGTHLKCNACLEKFASLRLTSHTFFERSTGVDNYMKYDTILGDVLEVCKSVGRPDLALLVGLVRTALLTQCEIAELSISDVLRYVLVRKSAKLAKALAALGED